MRQDQLKSARRKCHHGLWFGTTCRPCIFELKAVEAEREACAQIAEKTARAFAPVGAKVACFSIARQIRERGDS